MTLFSILALRNIRQSHSRVDPTCETIWHHQRTVTKSNRQRQHKAQFITCLVWNAIASSNARQMCARSVYCVRPTITHFVVDVLSKWCNSIKIRPHINVDPNQTTSFDCTLSHRRASAAQTAPWTPGRNTHRPCFFLFFVFCFLTSY